MQEIHCMDGFFPVLDRYQAVRVAHWKVAPLQHLCSIWQLLPVTSHRCWERMISPMALQQNTESFKALTIRHSGQQLLTS